MPKYEVTVYTKPIVIEVNAETAEMAQRIVDRTAYYNADKEIDYSQVKVSKDDKTQGIAKWLGVRFTSSSGLTEQFAQFAREFKAHVRKLIEPDYFISEYSRGHFEVSMFIRHEHTDRVLYLHISDVRFFPDSWYNNMLIRTAKSTNDYTGGSNCSTTLPDLKQAADRLVKYET